LIHFYKSVSRVSIVSDKIYDGEASIAG